MSIAHLESTGATYGGLGGGGWTGGLGAFYHDDEDD